MNKNEILRTINDEEWENSVLKKLILGQTVTVKFRFLAKSIEVRDMIIKIDSLENVLYLASFQIPFRDIITILLEK